MTEDQTPGMGPEKVERRDYAALVDSLAGTLDLRGGLSEAVDVVDYAAMSSHIASFLDLEAGLQSALAVSTRADAELPLRASAEEATDSVADLLLRIGDGDAAAWDEILRRYDTLVSTTVRSFGLQEADALDAIQMTWLRLMTNWHRVQDQEWLSGWLASTARHECLHILRQAKRTPDPVGTVADPSVDPEQRFLAAETVLTLHSLVAELPLRGRALLQALFSDNPRPYAEIARLTGTPVGSMGPARARALRQLRQLLDERGLESGADVL